MKVKVNVEVKVEVKEDAVQCCACERATCMPGCCESTCSGTSIHSLTKVLQPE